MKIDKEEALAKLADSGTPFLPLFEHGTLTIEMYKPQQVDLQEPHTRDEVYIVVAGHGEFLNQGERTTFGAGDFLFVPAGAEHRFENFTEDFATWVIFYGPEGGENPEKE
ncbi:cupin domain-containing protein [Flavobacteriaceae bacterium 3-367]|uniref:cupin domain-containing protein n=1 Tax=Eudoraea algarum TaxID=3417568 RepID=UPI00328F6C61